jgi:hypothetical protein
MTDVVRYSIKNRLPTNAKELFIDDATLQHIVDLRVIETPEQEVYDFIDTNIKSFWNFDRALVTFPKGKCNVLRFSFDSIVDATLFKINFSDYYSIYIPDSMESAAFYCPYVPLV